MIPKKIHYCWLSEDTFPRKIKRCMDTWTKIHPDYEIVCWNTKNFDIKSIDFVREAYEAKKWAFAADYIRMYALYTQGGIYLDSDVYLLKRFDEFLDNSFFSSLEYHPSQIERSNAMQYIDNAGHRIADVPYIGGIQIQAAVMGAEAGNSFVGEVLDWYKDKHFVMGDGTLRTDILSPYVYARIAEKYGFVYKDIDQQLPGRIHIYPSEFFAGNKHEATPRSYAIHMCAHSWNPTMKEKLKKWLHIR